MVYIPGVRNSTSDALSRHPSGPNNPPGMSLPDAMSAPPPRIPLALKAGLSIDPSDATSEADEDNLVASLCSAVEQRQPITWQHLKEETTSDDDLQLLLMCIEEGFPDKQADMPSSIRSFHLHQPHLYTVDGVAVYKDRVVIPASLRTICLNNLHSAHQGTTMMRAKADAPVFWPGIMADISNRRLSCTTCNTMSPSQASTADAAHSPNEAVPESVCGLFSP